MDLLTKKILAAGAVALGAGAVVLTMAVGPAARHETPAATSAADGVRIVVVDPPKAPIQATDRLDVRVAGAPAMAKADPVAATRIALPSSGPERLAPAGDGNFSEVDRSRQRLAEQDAQDAEWRRMARLRERDERLQWEEDRAEEARARQDRDDRRYQPQLADDRGWEQPPRRGDARERPLPEPYDEPASPPFGW